MADIMLPVDTAVVVPVNVEPLVDETDGFTREAVAYNAAGMALEWNFVTAAGAMSQTAVTPTTGGDYDWTDLGGGMMSIEIPASAGVSINNDTEGFGWFSGALIDFTYAATTGGKVLRLPDISPCRYLKITAGAAQAANRIFIIFGN